MSVRESFKQMLIAEGKGGGTLRAYTKDVEHFLDTGGIDSSTGEVREYLNSLPVSSRTKARKIISLRRFFSHLVDEKRTKRNPMKTITIPKFAKKPPEVIEMSNLYPMLHRAGKKEDKALIALCLGCGLRLHEAMQLTAANIDCGKRIIQVFGKGQKYRHVPLPRRLLQYLENVDLPLSQHMSVSTARRVVERLTEKVAGRKVTPHVLRHTYATYLLRKTGNLVLVQKVLGHSRIETTMDYIHLITEDIMVGADVIDEVDDGNN